MLLRHRLRRTLAATAITAATLLGAGGWAAAGTQTPVTGPPPGSAVWVADTTLGVRLPDPATAPPAEIAAFFDGLPAAQRDALAVRHPLVVGNLDGAPVRLRYRANALALTEELGKEQARATDPALTAQDHGAALARTERYLSLLADGRQILAFDPRGRGQVAEVLGDLASARHTAVVVPGSDIDLMTFDRARDRYGAPAGMARALYGATGAAQGAAVVAWAGYTTPVGVGLDAATEGLAGAGAQRLGHFLTGLAATTSPEAPATVFCHSYGSVVCGLAAPGPAQASNVVVLGSPGMGVPDAAALDPRVPLWAVERNGSDWIGDVPNVSLLGLGHGADPTGDGFGARPLASTDSHGHTGYFAPGTASLAAFADLTLGRPPAAATAR